MSPNLYKATGTLKYGKENRLSLNIPQDIANYYKSFIPKWVYVNRPRWDAHITVVRTGVEIPKDFTYWGKYEGKKLSFFYLPEIHYGKIYFWLNAFSLELEEIRKELGLTEDPAHPSMNPSLIPTGFNKRFHCTIANQKIL